MLDALEEAYIKTLIGKAGKLVKTSLVHSLVGVERLDVVQHVRADSKLVPLWMHAVTRCRRGGPSCEAADIALHLRGRTRG